MLKRIETVYPSPLMYPTKMNLSPVRTTFNLVIELKCLPRLALTAPPHKHLRARYRSPFAPRLWPMGYLIKEEATKRTFLFGFLKTSSVVPPILTLGRQISKIE